MSELIYRSYSCPFRVLLTSVESFLRELSSCALPRLAMGTVTVETKNSSSLLRRLRLLLLEPGTSDAAKVFA
jgi:hypothetical protein